MHIQELLEKASKLKIAIIGDLIEDRYIFGDVERVSPEAPVVVVMKTGETSYLGGAGNVFLNLLNIGVDTYLFTRGEKNIVAPDIFIHPGITPKKTRIMSKKHHLLRIDEENINQEDVAYDDLSWREDIEKLLPSLDAVIFSDYHKGTISAEIAQTIIHLCNEKAIPVIVDAKRDFEKYKYANVIKCNKHEAKGINVDELRVSLHVNYFIVTMGEYGAILNSSTGIDHVSTPSIGIIDVCGAGDTVMAVLAVAYSSGNNIIQSLELANKAAAETCKHAGVYAIKKEDLLKL